MPPKNQSSICALVYLYSWLNSFLPPPKKHKNKKQKQTNTKCDGTFNFLGNVCVFAAEKTCRPDQFSCGAGKPCIPPAWRCDNDLDCPNGADEQGCDNLTCRADEFSCANGKCIPLQWHCDQEDDCGDNSDEQQCPEPTCASGDFMCPTTSSCIPQRWVCDGDYDCRDGTDESADQCGTESPNACGNREFMCSSVECIHQSWKCDGDEDCFDGSDETQSECGRFSLAASYLHCLNQKHIIVILNLSKTLSTEIKYK